MITKISYYKIISNSLLKLTIRDFKILVLGKCCMRIAATWNTSKPSHDTELVVRADLV